MSGPFHRLVLAACWVVCAGWCRADPPVVLNTGSGQKLETVSRALSLGAGLVQPRLEFNFGFGTDERLGASGFLDSFTVTLQSVDQQFTAVYLTSDASGTVWAPATPGALTLDPESITNAAITYPALAPPLTQLTAYAVSAAIPPQFLGQTVNVFFDLFDNGDTAASQGWFSDLQVTEVPEPQLPVLLWVAATCLWFFAKTRE